MGAGRGENGDEDHREWRFSISDLDPVDEGEDADEDADEEAQEVVPGSPRPEHALFVLLGVLATLFAIFRALFA